MLKAILIAATLLLTSAPSVFAQDVSGQTGQSGNTTDTTGSNGAEAGWSDSTGTQGSGSKNGPQLGATSTGAPMFGGFAPANLALQTQGSGFMLPKTRLDSFVKTAPNADQIYGDEGKDGPPPFNTFTEEHRIERGLMMKKDLTTGHKSDAPDAWGWPQ